MLEPVGLLVAPVGAGQAGGCEHGGIGQHLAGGNDGVQGGGIGDGDVTAGRGSVNADVDIVPG